jgi:hypothetical protein
MKKYVRCINDRNTAGLTYNKIYELISINYGYSYIIDDTNIPYSYYSYRFEPYYFRNEKLKRIL